MASALKVPFQPGDEVYRKEFYEDGYWTGGYEIGNIIKCYGFSDSFFKSSGTCDVEFKDGTIKNFNWPDLVEWKKSFEKKDFRRGGKKKSRKSKKSKKSKKSSKHRKSRTHRKY